MTYKQASSKFWWYKFVWSGELIRRSTKQTNRRTAEQMEAAHKTALARGEAGIEKRKTPPTLEKFALRFREAIKTDCADKPATVSFYMDKLDCLLKNERLASTRLDRIDEAAIHAYRETRSKARSRRNKPFAVASINRELAVLRRLLRLAHEWKIINRVPRIRLLRGERTREFTLSHQQEPVYFAALSNEFHDVALLLLDTGLRIGEALSLEWLNVHLEPANGAKYGYLTVRAAKAKNSKSRNVPLTMRVRAMLEQQGQSKAGLVFHREDGRPLSQTSLNQHHKAVRERLKLPEDFVPHSLRHSFGTRLGEAGADAFTIMKLMGHSSVTVSQRYVHPSPETMELAVARLEALNGAKLHGVGIVSDIPAERHSNAVQ